MGFTYVLTWYDLKSCEYPDILYLLPPKDSMWAVMFHLLVSFVHLYIMSHFCAPRFCCVGLNFLSASRGLAGKNISKMTYFVSKLDIKQGCELLGVEEFNPPTPPVTKGSVLNLSGGAYSAPQTPQVVTMVLAPTSLTPPHNFAPTLGLSGLELATDCCPSLFLVAPLTHCESRLK